MRLLIMKIAQALQNLPAPALNDFQTGGLNALHILTETSTRD